MIEYVACVIVIAIFGSYALFIPSAPIRLGAALLVVIGTVIIAWQLHRRASAIPPPRKPGRADSALSSVPSLRDSATCAGEHLLVVLAAAHPLGMLLMIFGPLMNDGTSRNKRDDVGPPGSADGPLGRHPHERVRGTSTAWVHGGRKRWTQTASGRAGWRTHPERGMSALTSAKADAYVRPARAGLLRRSKSIVMGRTAPSALGAGPFIR